MQNAPGIVAFKIAEQCVRKVRLHAEGYGKHHVAAIGPGRAEARIQFPGALYGLFLQTSAQGIYRADFIPNSSVEGVTACSYSFTAAADRTNSKLANFESALQDFAERGNDQSQ